MTEIDNVPDKQSNRCSMQKVLALTKDIPRLNIQQSYHISEKVFMKQLAQGIGTIIKRLLTTINMAKCPRIIMQVSDNKLLRWWLHSVILRIN